MDSNHDKMFKKINEMYNKKGFLDKYGSDIWITIIITLVFFCIIAYYYVLNNLDPIKADWENQKCSPFVLPFAGFINKGPNDTNLDFTSKNFTGCIQSTLTNIIGTAFQPVYYIMNNLTAGFEDALNSVNAIRSVFDRIRNTVKDFSTEVMGRTLNVTMPIVQMLIGIKSMGAKMSGLLAGTLYTLLGSYLTLQSLFLFMLELITKILYILLGIILGLLVVAAIPIVGTWAIPISAMNIAIMILIVVPALMVQSFMSNVLSLSSRSLPKVPRCFAGDTRIEVLHADHAEKTINNIEVGDVLKNGEVVTAIMKFSASEQQLYNLFGVRVTGEHRVLHKTLGWLKVKYHPKSILLPNFAEPYVYCLGTNTKTFTIGDQVYSDWDDIDENVIKSLQDNCPNYKNTMQIHKYLDNGFVGSSLVALSEEKSLPIEKIQVHDYLANGEQVIGIIKIDALNLKGLTEYKVNEVIIRGCNINLCLAKHLNQNVEKSNLINNPREKYLYQLLTTTGTFKINGLVVRDYNYGIDKYL